MPGRQRRAVQRGVTEDDGCAVFIRRRVVNAYCRANPRQVAEKHHFLTPDTPVLDTLELPSRLYRDELTSLSSVTTSNEKYSGKKIAGVGHKWMKSNDTTAPYDDGLSVERLDSQISNTRAALSCNMEPVSMDLTCSTQTEQHTQKSVGRSKHTPSLDEKLHFLKETLASELCRMNASAVSHSETTITPSAPLYTPISQTTATAATHNSHSSTATTKHSRAPRKESDPPALNKTTGRVNRARKRESVLLETDSVQRDGTKDKKALGTNTENHSTSELHNTSTELDSVRLISCDAEEDEKMCTDETVNKKEGEMGKDCNGESLLNEGENCRGDPGDDCCDGGGGGEGGEESEESDIEVGRGVGEEDPMMASPPTAETGRSSLILSPDLPEAHSAAKRRKCYGVDLSELCGLSSIDTASTHSSNSSERRKSGCTKTTTSEIRQSLGGVSSDKRCNVGARHRKGKISSSTPKKTARSIDKLSPLVKRKMTRRKRSFLTTSASAELCPSTAELNREQSCTRESGDSHSLEHHFNQLQITPILPLTHTTTKSLAAPLTSTPTTQHTQSLKTPSNPRFHTVSPALVTSHHHPLTSTPIFSNNTHPAPDHTHHLTASLEREMKDDKFQANGMVRQWGDMPSATPRYDGVGSTMEQLMDFDAVPYQASTVLDLSLLHSPANHPATQSKSKTILSRVWQKKNIRQSAHHSKKKTQSLKSATCEQQSANRGSKSATCEQQSANRGPKSATCEQQSANRGSKSATCEQQSANRGPKSATCELRKPLSANRGPKSATCELRKPLSANRGQKSAATCRPTQCTSRTVAAKAANARNIHKSSTNKKMKRQYIVPPPLRQRQRMKRLADDKNQPNTTTVGKTTANRPRKAFSPQTYPTCILVHHQHSIRQRNKLLTMSPLIAACSLDNSSVPEDILTKVLTCES